MTDQPRRHDLKPPLDHELDATPGNWKFRCSSCGTISSESPSKVCRNCQVEMERIIEDGGTVEAHK